MESYNADREITPTFLARVSEWIANSGEVLVMLRYLGGGGSKDFAFCRTMDEFERMLDNIPIGTDIVVFRDRQLPLRGVVDDAFVTRAMEFIVEGDEYLLVTLATISGSAICKNYRFSNNRPDMREDFDDHRGQNLAFGLFPAAFFTDDSDRMISASKGGIDGPR